MGGRKEEGVGGRNGGKERREEGRRPHHLGRGGEGGCDGQERDGLWTLRGTWTREPGEGVPGGCSHGLDNGRRWWWWWWWWWWLRILAFRKALTRCDESLHNYSQLVRDYRAAWMWLWRRRRKRLLLLNGLDLKWFPVTSAKTQCIFIGNRQLLSLIPPDTRISFDGDSIYSSTHVKNLGVHMDRYMTFDVHVSELNKKVVGYFMRIYRISLNFEKRTRTVDVQSLVLIIVNYCIRIWGTTNATLLNNVQKLQNFAAIVAVRGARKYDRVFPILKELKWLKIKEKHVSDTCTTMFKAMQGSYPEWLLSFKTVNEATGSITRQNDNLYVPWTRKDWCQVSYCPWTKALDRITHLCQRRPKPTDLQGQT